MASVYRSVLQRNGLLLSFVLLMSLLILYAGWSSNQRSQRSATTADDKGHRRQSFVDKQVVESSKHGPGAGAGGEASGADKHPLVSGIARVFDAESAATLQQLVARKATARDPQLIDLVRRLMNPPPTEGPIVWSDILHDTQQSTEVDALLKKQENGFFIECGAYDGETASNSLPFEVNRKWTGLLIEIDPYYYVQVLGKNRNVWSLNACLSPYDYATLLQHERARWGGSRVRLVEESKNLSTVSDETRKRTFNVSCFPLETILLAINRTRVDYFSLDIEGLELDILKTIPYDRFDIRVLTVEYEHGRSGKEEHKSFMESKGFRTHKDLIGRRAQDYLFVKD